MLQNAVGEVNHWRGQCLDSFARVEFAVIDVIEAWNKKIPGTAPTLAPTAANRTKNLAANLRKHFADDPHSRKLSSSLSLWKYRENQRNELVHGTFTVKERRERWVLINQIVLVKDQTAISSERMLTDREAEAMLAAIVEERKSLIAAIDAFKAANF